MMQISNNIIVNTTKKIIIKLLNTICAKLTYEQERKANILWVLLFLFNLMFFLTRHTNVFGLVKQREQNISRINNKESSFDSNIINVNETKIKRLPQAIIIGSRKCGTRALLKFLQINPSIQSAKKEIHFFDKPQNYKLGIDWYKEQMPLSSGGEITIEKSPAYFVTDGVPERIKKMNTTIKLVLILRDPVTRLISDFSQLVANKIDDDQMKSTHNTDIQQHLFEEDEDSMYSDGDYYSNINSSLPLDNKTFNSSNIKVDSWLKAETNFENYVRRSDGGIDDQRRAVKIGMYSIFLEKWLNVFSRGQFHFVDGENLIAKPHEELQKLELFLGIKSVIKQEDFIFNQRKGFYCIKTNNNNTNENNSNASKQANANIQLNCLSKSKGRRHVNVKKDLIEDLKKFYAPYNEYLYTLTGKNFNR